MSVFKKVQILALTLAIAFSMTAQIASAKTMSASGKYDLTGVKPIKLTLSSPLATNHGCYIGFYVPWMEEVEKETNGLVTFEVFTSGELIEGGKEYDALRGRVIDIAAPLTPIYDSSRFPTSDVTMLPLIYSNSAIATAAYDAMINSDRIIADGKTYSEIEFDKNNVKYIAHNIPPGSAFNTTGKTIEKVSDIDGLRMRTGSRTHQLFAADIGLTAISMPAYDLFDAMSRGAVEGSFIHVADWTAYGFQDLFKYSIENLNFGHFGAGFAMNQSRWDSLPPVLQQIFEDAAVNARITGAKVWDDRTVEVTESAKKNGVSFVDFADLPKDVQDTFNKSMYNTWEKYIEMQEEVGVPGKEIVKLWHDSIIEAGGKVPSGVDKLFQ